MRGPSQKPPKYRLHKPSGLAVVTIDGQAVYLGKHGSEESHKAYTTQIDRWRLKRYSTEPVQPRLHEPAYTVGELIVEYFKYASSYYRKNGKATSEVENIRLALRALRKLHETTPVREFGPLALKDVRSLMVAGWEYTDRKGKRRRTSHCRRSINKDIHRIRRMFQFGVENELVPPDVLIALRAVTALKKGRTQAADHPPIKPVSEADLEAAIEFMPPPVAAMVRLQLHTGARPGEVCLLRPGDVHADGDLNFFVPSSHKTEHVGKDKSIPLGPRAIDVLGPWLDRDSTQYCFSPYESEVTRNAAKRATRKTPLTPSHRRRNAKSKRCRHLAQRYSVDAYRRAIQSACDKAGVSRFSPHQLRHTAATKIREEFGIEAAAATLGHAQVSTTELYAERDFRTACKVATELG